MHGYQFFVQGTEESEGIHIEFYCPEPLELILRKLKLVAGDKAKFEYFGRNKINNTLQHQYFVEKLEKTAKN